MFSVLLPESCAAHFFMQRLLHLNRGKHQRLVVAHEVVKLNRIKFHFLGLKLGNFSQGTAKKKYSIQMLKIYPIHFRNTWNIKE